MTTRQDELNALNEVPELVERAKLKGTDIMIDQFYLYILECADGSYYVGSTSNMDERLARHNAGEAAEWTKNRRPVRVVYREQYESLLKARQREEQIKGWTRLKKENLIRGIWKKL